LPVTREPSITLLGGMRSPCPRYLDWNYDSAEKRRHYANALAK
jgi:hypothetical protein